jgi:hypothetical protein
MEALAFNGLMETFTLVEVVVVSTEAPVTQRLVLEAQVVAVTAL